MLPSALSRSDSFRSVHIGASSFQPVLLSVWQEAGYNWSSESARLRTHCAKSDRVDGREGPPDAAVTVEAMQGNRVAWTFHEAGERGDVVTNKLYMVTKFNGGEIGTLYTYFSLANGQKLRSNQYVPLTTRGLEALDLSIDN